MMSKLFTASQPGPRRRADAERSSTAILDAACRVWSTRPEASVEDIAAGAGVTRQTVYAHYPSREVLLASAIERVRIECLAAIDAAAIDEGLPAVALTRLLDAIWKTFAAFPFLLHGPVSHGEGSHTQGHGSYDQHAPVREKLERLARRGQASGDFDRQASPAWLATVMIGMQHTAVDEVNAGRMTASDALAALQHSVPRVFGVERTETG